MDDALETLLKKTLAETNLNVSSAQRDQLLAYATLLKNSPHHSAATWNSDEEGMAMHFKDSFLTFPKKTPEFFLDLGSGAGIPGIIYTILWPDTQATLLDSQQRRCAVLEATIAKLNLQKRVSVVYGRAEEKAHDPDLRETFDLVTARALAPFPEFLEYTVAFLRVGGHLHALRGGKDSNALSEHGDLLKKFHFQTVSQHSYKLKESDPASRFVFLLQKKAVCASVIPRSNNQIKKQAGDRKNLQRTQQLKRA